MVTEKKELVGVFREISGLAVMRSTEKAVQKGRTLPLASVDYADFNMKSASENAKAKTTTTTLKGALFVESLADDDEQDDLFGEWFEKILSKLCEAYDDFDLFTTTIGTTQFGTGRAFAVAYQIDFGERIYNVTP